MEQTPQFENSSGTQTSSDEPAPAWQPLSAIERRIVGVLIEKAKTTPDSYPLSLNALTTGCNQKSNRSPQMNLDTDDVEESMEDLRTKGAVGVIQGGGRVIKYRRTNPKCARITSRCSKQFCAAGSGRPCDTCCHETG